MLLNVRDRIYKILILFCLTTVVSAQTPELKSGFIQDSLSIGEEVEFWMKVSYPISTDVLLPDTNYNFAPFEFLDKKYFETQFDGEEAIDSAVYYLQSFEIDKIQYLSLPVTVFKNGDSTQIFSARDSIFFRDLAPIVNDTTSLKSNVEYLSVNKQFNYPLWAIILASLGVIVVVLLLIFGKRIRRYFLLKRMKKDFEKFNEQFSALIQEVKKTPEKTTVEKSLNVWKRYAEKLEKEPFRKLTTTEILEYPFTSELSEALKTIDRLIYGNQKQDNIFKELEVIEDYTQHRYSIKKMELKNDR